MIGMYSSNGRQRLGNIEKGRCCRPKSQTDLHYCYVQDVSSSFDHRGWSKCKSGFYIRGLWRNDCDRLGCIEKFFCCQMGEYNGNSWVEKPDLSIKVKDASGQFKHCSMNAMDKSASSDTYQCKSLSDHTIMLSMNALRFDIEDKSPLTEPIKGFCPVICSAHSAPYKYTKALTTAISTSSSLTIGAGFSLAVKVGASVQVSAGFGGSGTETTFTKEISASSSFTVESNRKSTYIYDNGQHRRLSSSSSRHRD